MSLFADDMILYIEIYKVGTRKLRGHQQIWNKVVRFNIYTQQLLQFFILTANTKKENLRQQSHLLLPYKEWNI